LKKLLITSLMILTLMIISIPNSYALDNAETLFEFPLNTTSYFTNVTSGSDVTLNYTGLTNTQIALDQTIFPNSSGNVTLSTPSSTKYLKLTNDLDVAGNFELSFRQQNWAYVAGKRLFYIKGLNITINQVSNVLTLESTSSGTTIFTSTVATTSTVSRVWRFTRVDDVLNIYIDDVLFYSYANTGNFNNIVFGYAPTNSPYLTYNMTMANTKIGSIKLDIQNDVDPLALYTDIDLDTYATHMSYIYQLPITTGLAVNSYNYMREFIDTDEWSAYGNRYIATCFNSSNGCRMYIFSNDSDFYTTQGYNYNYTTDPHVVVNFFSNGFIDFYNENSATTDLFLSLDDTIDLTYIDTNYQLHFKITPYSNTTPFYFLYDKVIFTSHDDLTMVADDVYMYFNTIQKVFIPVFSGDAPDTITCNDYLDNDTNFYKLELPLNSNGFFVNNWSGIDTNRAIQQFYLHYDSTRIFSSHVYDYATQLYTYLPDFNDINTGITLGTTQCSYTSIKTLSTKSSLVYVSYSKILESEVPTYLYVKDDLDFEHIIFTYEGDDLYTLINPSTGLPYDVTLDTDLYRGIKDDQVQDNLGAASNMVDIFFQVYNSHPLLTSVITLVSTIMLFKLVMGLLY